MNARLFMGISLYFLTVLCSSPLLNAQEEKGDAARLLADGETLTDARLGPLRNLRDAYHPWTPPASKEEWEQVTRQMKTQLRVSNGLVPEWPKTDLNAVVHGEIQRGDYIVQRVYFESMPGHYVTGNLYRPVQLEGKVPGILCPHGHWSDARFYDAGQKAALGYIAEGGEKYLSGARHHLQARMVHLARMGCIVFHYDMVGYSDSKVIDHRNAFNDAECGLWLINSMGLQTWNSIRALDFLTSLPQVDEERIAITGASGGGTQTFMLAALDERVDVAFPAVMVSTNMQGGCVCENADYLRQGINNVAIAALFAPKPLGLSGADDWTINIETKGLPVLKQIYSLYGAADKVYAEAHPEFKHNYNYVSRAIMYRWMAEHLPLPDDAPLIETDFWPIPAEQLSVFDADHPQPGNAKSAAELKAEMIDQLRQYREQMMEMAAVDMAAYQRMMRPIVRVLLDDVVPNSDQVVLLENMWGGEIQAGSPTDKIVATDMTWGYLRRKGSKEAVPYLILKPEKPNGQFVLWFDEAGTSRLLAKDESIHPDVRKLLDAGYCVASVDLFLTGESKHPEWGHAIPVDGTYSGYTFGYNKTTIAQRVHDILTAIAVVRKDPQLKKLHLVGTGDAGLWSLLAGALMENTVDTLIVNLDGFSFANISKTSDPNYLPGALRYGDIGGLGLLATPKRLIVGGVAEDSETARQLKLSQPARSESLTISAKDLNDSQIVKRLLAP